MIALLSSKKFYLNVVGYKVANLVAYHYIGLPFYLNVVGYKDGYEYPFPDSWPCFI